MIASAHPPERLQVELQSLVGPALSQRGYGLVGQGPTQVMWRRQLSNRVIGGLAVLGVLCIGGLGSGDAVGVVIGLAAAIAAATLVHMRRPATITVSMSPIPGGTQLAVTGGPDATVAEALVRSAAGPPPSAQMHGCGDSTAPQHLWRTPGT